MSHYPDSDLTLSFNERFRTLTTIVGYLSKLREYSFEIVVDRWDAEEDDECVDGPFPVLEACSALHRLSTLLPKFFSITRYTACCLSPPIYSSLPN